MKKILAAIKSFFQNYRLSIILFIVAGMSAAMALISLTSSPQSLIGLVLGIACLILTAISLITAIIYIVDRD